MLYLDVWNFSSIYSFPLREGHTMYMITSILATILNFPLIEILSLVFLKGYRDKEYAFFFFSFGGNNKYIVYDIWLEILNNA